MKTYRNHRAEPYFTYLKNGQKTIEVRLYKGKYKLIKSGDYIVVYNQEETDSVKVKVLDVRRYKTFKDLLSNEKLNKIFPDKNSVEEGLKVLYGFYTKEQEKEFGAVAIEVSRAEKDNYAKN